MEKKFKIEMLDQFFTWSDTEIEHNEFDSRWQAEDEIHHLSRKWSCSKRNFRVVEVEKGGPK